MLLLLLSLYKMKVLEREQCIKLQNYGLKKQTSHSLLIQTLIHLIKRGDITIPLQVTENT